MASQKVLDWLLEDSQPSIRYLTLRHLVGKPESDAEVRGAKRQVAERGWAAQILAERDPAGWWVSPQTLYRPKYLSTNWMLIVLADLGLTRKTPAIRESCELWMERFAKPDGGFGSEGDSKGHLCIVGNTARALLRFGYVDEPRVRASLDWLVENAAKLGGWSCFGSGRNLDSWEGLSAFAAFPRSKWTGPMEECVLNAVEFYLERELQRQGDRYEPWYRFHYPVHYYYDLLVGLDILTALGETDDRRMKPALTFLTKKRRPDGRWNLDAVHPDVEGGMADWFERHPKHRPTPFSLETVGQPSKMITLTALRVLSRVDGTG